MKLNKKLMPEKKLHYLETKEHTSDNNGSIQKSRGLGCGSVVEHLPAWVKFW